MYYAGVDAHAQYCRVVVLDKDGDVIANGNVRTAEPEEIARFLAAYRPLSVVVESCPFWPWLRDQLSGPGVTFHLAHARELRAIAQHAQKNDGVDAQLLARMLLTGLIPPAHAHASAELEQLRLIRHHAWLTRYRTMCANRIHGQLHQSGIQLSREQLLKPSGREQLRGFALRLSLEQRRVIRTHFILIHGLNRMLKQVRKQICHQAARSPQAILLGTIPGVGPYWSLMLGAELSPVQRFATADRLVSYAGLAPTTHGSGGHVSHGPLPRAANRWVRGALVCAVMSHLRHAPNSRLTQYYTRTKARLGWKKARVATARKLARIIFGMLRTHKPWHG